MIKALKWSKYNLELNAGTCIMGILNVTPDSFFDGGHHVMVKDAVSHGIKMVSQGADIIDIGGESTRPFSDPVSIKEELSRVIPVIKALSQETDKPVSIDTYKSEVASQAIDAGAQIINDISALRYDPAMGSLVAKAGLPVVLMHMKGTPKNMQVNPVYENLTEEIITFLVEAVENAVNAGIKKELIIIDPGIGFGKSCGDNLTIIKELSKFSPINLPVLAGPSNKAFIGNILDLPVENRTTGTMAAIAATVMNGANIVRVHDVKATRETITIIDAIKTGEFRGN